MYLYKTIYEFGGRGEAAAHQIFVKFDLSRIEINSEKVSNSRKNYKLVEILVSLLLLTRLLT